MNRSGLALAAMLLTVTGYAQQPSAIPNGTPPGFTPAPVPNQDITIPIRVDEGGPQLSARLQQPHVLLRSGDGYIFGSNFSEDLERRSRGATNGFAPTVGIKVPLD